jgi:hypothetical protein
MLADCGRDLAVELLDLGDEWLDRHDQRQHERSAGCLLRLADAALGRTPELGEKLRGLLATGIRWRARNPARRCSPSPRASTGLG